MSHAVSYRKFMLWKLYQFWNITINWPQKLFLPFILKDKNITLIRPNYNEYIIQGQLILVLYN